MNDSEYLRFLAGKIMQSRQVIFQANLEGGNSHKMAVAKRELIARALHAEADRLVKHNALANLSVTERISKCARELR